ncbi:MAG: TonB-dependent receptor [Alphaproteobacteria bacterium]|nr:TonB-dependent receptor [Alphaproteobacteria bacterium]
MTLKRYMQAGLVRVVQAVVLAAPVAVLLHGPVLAEPAPRPVLKVEQVTVTARKREESEQTVPIAMTAISTQLKIADVRDIRDLVAFTPNVRIDENPQRANAASITIRGISPSRTDDNSIDSPIGVLIDGIYLGSLPGQVIENFDVERIEILRGPQGTLFGRNTVGGAINVFRTEPTGEWGAKVQYTTGSWNDQEFRGVFNIPIVEGKLAAKAYAIIINRDGYLKNTYLNTTQPQRDYKNYGIALKFTPTDWLKAVLTVERFDDRSQGGAYLGNYNFAPGVLPKPTNINDIDASGGFVDCFLPGLFGGENVPCRTSLAIPKTISGNLPNPGKVITDAYTLNMTADVSDSLKLVSVTGYRRQHEQTSYDFDGSSANFITITTNAHYRQFSEELRLEGDWDTSLGKISLVTGGYYWDSYFSRGWSTGGDFWNTVSALSGYQLSTDTWVDPSLATKTGFSSPIAACLAPRTTPALQAVFGQVACDPDVTTPYGPGVVQKLYETQGTKSVAFFAHADWEFYPQFTLTAGLRWTYERKAFTGYQSYLAPLARNDVFDFPGSTGLLKDSWRQLTPTAALSYQMTPDVMFYVSFSEGWHSGGYFGVNQNVSDFNRVYQPEKSKAYEVGMKGQFFDNRVQLNIDAFRNDFKNKQESAIALDPSTNTVVTLFTNVGGLRYQGLEAELQWVVTEELNISASAGYLDAKYTSLLIGYPNAVNANVPVVQQATFLIPRNAPKWTAGGQATYTVPVGPGELSLSSRIDWVSDQYGSTGAGLYNESYTFMKAHVDLSASLSYEWSNYKVTVFGRNLTNHVTETPAYIATLFASSTITQPRSWGVQIGATF